ncbi:hypothetical protein ACHAWF_011481 [Thalassiosira exigua]
MCRRNDAATTNIAKPIPPAPWRAVVLPLVAGLLHLQVFYHAALCVHRSFVTSSASESTSDEFRRACFLFDRAIFLAYAFDIFCCRCEVIPFSRCTRSSDIVDHHVPTLALALPLAVPLWGNCGRFEATSSSILDLTVGSERRNRFINAYTAASGFAYVSSLNEVLMCLQRVEMSLGGARSFRDVPSLRRRFFTSRCAVGAELGYKLCFFWGMSILACKACCDFDRALYDAVVAPAAYDGSVWRTLATVYSSPAALRGALFRAFSMVMYPSMGMRCYKKIRQFRREGREAKSA